MHNSRQTLWPKVVIVRYGVKYSLLLLVLSIKLSITAKADDNCWYI